MSDREYVGAHGLYASMPTNGTSIAFPFCVSPIFVSLLRRKTMSNAKPAPKTKTKTN